MGEFLLSIDEKSIRRKTNARINEEVLRRKELESNQTSSWVFKCNYILKKKCQAEEEKMVWVQCNQYPHKYKYLSLSLSMIHQDLLPSYESSLFKLFQDICKQKLCSSIWESTIATICCHACQGHHLFSKKSLISGGARENEKKITSKSRKLF